MTIELYVLLAAALLCLALPLVYGPLYAQQVGLDAMIGNREGLPEPKGAAGRGIRAHRNLIENLVPFAAVVLVAYAFAVSTPATQWAATAFLAARIVHAACYIAGIKLLRTLAYLVGFAATLVIAVAAATA